MIELPYLKNRFLLNPEIRFLNFGSFGACPDPVFNDYVKWQRLLESEPVQFIAYNGVAYMKNSREALGKYINCHADDIVFTPNPTFAFNIVAKNLQLKPGDQILATNLEYGAMDRTWDYYCKKAGAEYVRLPISLPIESKEHFIEEFLKGINEKTKVVFISQITSATALILPVKEICAAAKKLGLITIVDGAHVPGHIHLDISQLDVDYYTGACHKWMMTPKGCSFLYVKKELQNALDPLIISWGYESENPSASQFLDYHQFNGTRDFSAYLTIPKAIEFIKEFNWVEVSNTCKNMVLDNAERFCQFMGTTPVSPLTGEFIGQMFSIPLKGPMPNLQQTLFEKYRIEVPVTRCNDRHFIRYSINTFNSQGELDYLMMALKKEME